jgi:NADPH-dependent 2,4-dienoyl-CoA reductase/sulfur reductase-like enzyme
MADLAVREIDLLVIGAGPAGMAAAIAAAEASREVAVLDDNPAAGGQIWRGGARGAAGAAADWFARLAASGARVHAGSAVVDCLPGGAGRPTIVSRDGSGLHRWRPAAVVLATGARERFVPFPGWTLPGVVGAGGVQALVKQGLDVRGRRIVVAGSGPLLLAVADLLVAKGAVVPVVAEQAPAARLAAFAAGLLTQPAKLAQAIGLRRRIGGVVRPGTFPTAVRALGDGLTVTLASGAAGRERQREIECDILACGFGLVPNVEVARALGCRIEAGRIAVDGVGATTVAGVWAAGECTGVGGVDAALVEGRMAGLAAAGRDAEAWALLPERRRWERFAAALDRTFALDPRLARLAADDTLVCRCEDVAYGRLRCHGGWREAKLQTRIGMGPCQGRVCGTATEVLFGWAPDDVRPPFTPLSLGDLA